MSKSKGTAPARLIWFEIPADDTARAKKFYGTLFGWKMNPLPYMADYWHLDTGGADASPNGGLMKRLQPAHTITTYFHVPSVTQEVESKEHLAHA